MFTFFFSGVYRFRYIITFVFFVLWLVFFDQNKISYVRDLHRMARQMENEKRFYQEQIIAQKNIMHAIVNNSDSLEMIAREEYLMKRENEDVFVLTDQRNYAERR